MKEKFISRFILGCFGGKAKVGKGSNLDNFGRTKCEDKRKEASQVQFPPWSASLARAAPDQLSLSYLPSKSLSVRDSLLSVSIPGSGCQQLLPDHEPGIPCACVEGTGEIQESEMQWQL